MKKFFLLSDTGRLKRGRYALYLYLIGSVWTLAELVENIPLWFAALLELACLCWWIYIISARCHDQWLPWWIAWIRLLLNIISWFVEWLAVIARILIICLWVGLLFAKWVEEDNEYWPNPYKKWENMNKYNQNEDDKKKIEKNIEQKNKSVK